MDVAPPADGRFDITGAMYSVPWILTFLSICTVGARFYLRKKFSSSIDPDDWIMLATLVFQIAYQVIVTLAVTKGSGKSLPPTITPDEMIEMLKWAWFTTPLAVLVSTTARISIAILLVRIFGIHRWFRWFMIIFTTILAVIGIVNIIIPFLQARPVEALWNITMVVPRWDPMIQQICSSVLHAFLVASDLFYVIFPVSFVWKLHLDTRRKIGLTILLALSIITFGVALAKLVMVIDSIENANDVAGDTNHVFYVFSVMTLITGVEQNLVIIIGCVPKLRPITKLQFPALGSVGTELKSFLKGSWMRRTSSSLSESKQGGSHGDSSGYADLERQPQLLRFDQVNGLEASAAYAHSRDSLPRKGSGNNIQLTNEFVFSETNRTSPREL